MGKDSRLKKLARTLLTTTCLTAAAGAAHANTFLESSFGGGDFSNVLTSPSNIGVTADVVQGTLETPCCTDTADFFQIPGLVAGAKYTLSYVQNSGFSGVLLQLYDGTTTFSGPYGSGSVTTITVPVDNNLVFGIAGSEGPSSYTIGFAAQAPEPGTLGLAATALASALALRRRKKS
jgi:hypothetical protein